MVIFVHLCSSCDKLYDMSGQIGHKERKNITYRLQSTASEVGIYENLL